MWGTHRWLFLAEGDMRGMVRVWAGLEGFPEQHGGSRPDLAETLCVPLRGRRVGELNGQPGGGL